MGNSISSKDYRAMMPQQPKRKQKKEESLQIQLANYMRLKHPEIVFRSDFAAGIKMSMGQAILHKRMQYGKSYPDFFIAKPAGKYSGCFLELKKSREGVFLKDGSLSTIAHIQEQAAMLELLKSLSYFASFACGFDEATSIIENYLAA